MQVLLKRTAVSMIALIMAMPLSAAAQTAKSVPESQMQMQLSFAPLVKQTAGAVVNVYAERVVQRQSPLPATPFRAVLWPTHAESHGEAILTGLRRHRRSKRHCHHQ